MTFPEPSTLRDIGTAAGVVLMAAAAAIGRANWGQLRGRKEENGDRGKRVRGMLIDLAAAMQSHMLSSELRHQESVQSFAAQRVQLNRQDLRIDAIEELLKRKGE